MRTPLVILAVALVATVWLISPALAGPPTQFVKDLMDRVIAIQNDPALASPAQEAERAKAIRRNIQQSFDFQIMAQNSLGPTYGRLSSAQRQEFLKIFSALFQDSYTRLVLNFLKKETVNYRKENQEGDRARVDTTLVRTNETIPVEYLLLRQGQGWLLFDVIVDGVSILDNYQKTFARTIESKSFDFLMDKLRTQHRTLQ